MSLLQQMLKEPRQPVPINNQLVSDMRNYFNALPASYLYYSLAKENLPTTTNSIVIDGFDLASSQIPIYFTKAEFTDTVKQLSNISKKLQQENWILARQNTDNLQDTIKQAFYHDYISWWRNFMNRSHPNNFQNYKQAQQLTNIFVQENSIAQLIHLIQQQTSPDFSNNGTIFNNEIASQFAEINLLSQSALSDLSSKINELKEFLNTLSVINDQGKTAFMFTKSRFNGDTLSNPLNGLYNLAQQLPEPAANWTKQIADDFWYLLIKDSRAYINQQWQNNVYEDYMNHIAKRYPFDQSQSKDVTINDFERFFASNGILNNYMENYLKPFLDTTQAQWQPKKLNDYILPIAAETVDELIRANIISNMFFPSQSQRSKIEFSLQKINLDPIVDNLKLTIGENKLKDTQNTSSFTKFVWPQSDASLALNSIEGDHFELNETGPWAFFKILQKVNVLIDKKDSSSLQILFEINGNSGRYVLKTRNQINPFMPGILSGFKLPENIS
jgi:intracellular multiplication protein IcmF